MTGTPYRLVGSGQQQPPTAFGRVSAQDQHGSSANGARPQKKMGHGGRKVRAPLSSTAPLALRKEDPTRASGGGPDPGTSALSGGATMEFSGRRPERLRAKTARNVQLGAILGLFLGIAWLFLEPVPVRNGLIGIGVRIGLGIVLNWILQHFRARLVARGDKAPYVAEGMAAAAGVLGLVLIAMFVVRQLGHWLPFAFFLGTAWIAISTFAFIDAPTTARYRRERYETDLNELRDA